MKEKNIKNTPFKRVYIITSLILLSLAVTFIDAVIMPPYFSKIPIKILFFLALPLLFFVINRDEVKAFKSIFRPKRKGILASLLIGLAIYAVIVGGYFVTRTFVDYSAVTENLTGEMGITADNFIYVSLYISLMNSFLEEFFFRGFGFITLKKYFGKGFAYLFSPILFAVYHVGMLLGMFSVPMLLLVLTGLIAGGLIFNFLNDKFGNIYPSWFAHMFANFAINTVGFILFSKA